MFKYLIYLPKILVPITLLFTGTLLSLLANFSQPFIYKIIYDELIQTTDQTILLLIVIFSATTFLIYSLSNLLTETLSTHIRGKLISLIRNDISAEILTYRYSFFRNHEFGAIVQKLIPEVDTLSTTIAAVVKSAVYVFQLVLILLVALYFNFFFFLICFSSLVLYVFWHGIIKRPIGHFTSQVQLAQGGLYGYFFEHLQNIKTIKLFNGYQRSIDHLTIKLRYIKIRSLLNSLFRSLLSVSTKILDIAILGIVIFSLYRITAGEMTIGFYLLFTIFIRQLITPVSFLVELGNHLQSGKVAAQRIEDIRTGEIESSGKIKCGVENRGIEYKKVDFRYDQNRRILEGVSFKIDAGSSVAFVGASGSGKSTIIQLLMRLYEPSAGGIYLDNNPIQSYDLTTLREQINVLSQDFFLFNDSIRNNVDPKEIHKTEDIQTMLKEADLLTFSDKLDYGIGEGGWNLSGGERQRLSIARLLAKRPKVIVLDEATSNLDPKTERIVMDNIQQLRVNIPGLIIVMITHRVQHLSQMDTVYFIDGGRVADRGIHEELNLRNKEYVNVLHTLNSDS